jgi:O-antigen/teichoic acid export membrane protein
MGELYRFGIWVLGSAILSYLSSNLDDVVVGRVLDATALGFYTNAFTLSSFTGRQMTGVISQVAFPAYSRLQSDIPRLRNAYFRTLRVVAVIAFPVATGLWLIGPELVETLMGAKWLPLIPAFNVLLIWGLLRSIGSTTGPLLLASGRPAINTQSQFAAVVLLAIAIYPFTKWWGIVGAGWATVVTGIGPVVVVMILTTKYLSARLRELVHTLAIPAVSTALMASVLLAIKYALPAVSGGWLLIWAPILGALLYGGTILAARKYLNYQLG